MSRYIDGKIRFCPKCKQNVNDCICQDNNDNCQQIKFVQLSQQKYDEIVKSAEQNNTKQQ